MRAAFPFTAIGGQARMNLALLLSAVDRRIGGVMVFGDRGTGKSTAVRALAALPMQVVAGCRYGCDPADAGARPTRTIVARARNGPRPRRARCLSSICR